MVSILYNCSVNWTTLEFLFFVNWCNRVWNGHIVQVEIDSSIINIASISRAEKRIDAAHIGCKDSSVSSNKV